MYHSCSAPADVDFLQKRMEAEEEGSGVSRKDSDKRREDQLKSLATSTPLRNRQEMNFSNDGEYRFHDCNN